ncbi:metallophosphoesterase [Coriobacterium glomerans PW2]|uniref:Metallophosphoesterase n=1 Tax=Coriobacterium glomerans (strain ATCC 49209 / DSM 20642 / JCM 10262 / PW2) TaxID=700015 RepID=F2N7F6_CORGP|nr:metallophosphoesterase family protein [Coriobacterium glomerans]AEB06772.1 metallophosphoesterase [Coriobacterium glomerans PW2]
MATYVTSDAHGHLRALDRALELAQPSAEDTLYVLGDMIDRGPDPVGVIDLVRALPCARAILGNHERMMLDALAGTDELDADTWVLNGGWTTAPGLDRVDRDKLDGLMDWLCELPLYDVVETADRLFILVHAGIDALAARAYLASANVDCSHGEGAAAASREQLCDMMSRQDPMDLLWIRGEFWGSPTGFVGTDGTGPVVVAGHTPSISLRDYADVMGNPGTSSEGHGCVVPVGDTTRTGGVADRIDIDCSAAAAEAGGCVGVLRLDDGQTWYAPVRDGE